MQILVMLMLICGGLLIVHAWLSLIGGLFASKPDALQRGLRVLHAESIPARARPTPADVGSVLAIPNCWYQVVDAEEIRFAAQAGGGRSAWILKGEISIGEECWLVKTRASLLFLIWTGYLVALCLTALVGIYLADGLRAALVCLVAVGVVAFAWSRWYRTQLGRCRGFAEEIAEDCAARVLSAQGRTP